MGPLIYVTVELITSTVFESEPLPEQQHLLPSCLTWMCCSCHGRWDRCRHTASSAQVTAMHSGPLNEQSRITRAEGLNNPSFICWSIHLNLHWAPRTKWVAYFAFEVTYIRSITCTHSFLFKSLQATCHSHVEVCQVALEQSFNNK